MFYTHIWTFTNVRTKILNHFNNFLFYFSLSSVTCVLHSSLPFFRHSPSASPLSLSPSTSLVDSCQVVNLGQPLILQVAIDLTPKPISATYGPKVPLSPSRGSISIFTFFFFFLVLGWFGGFDLEKGKRLLLSFNFLRFWISIIFSYLTNTLVHFSLNTNGSLGGYVESFTECLWWLW